MLLTFDLFKPNIIPIWEVRSERERRQWDLNPEAAFLIVIGRRRAWMPVSEIKGSI